MHCNGCKGIAAKNRCPRLLYIILLCKFYWFWPLISLMMN